MTTSEQARADAMADARTAVRLSEDTPLPGLDMAAVAGEWAIHWMHAIDRTGYRPPRHAGFEDSAYASARRAAHYAFLAVPELREE
jgi:hypothetical protein